ncbi:hypothetical protein C6988_05690 [Nitrosopumilus sp. b1]|uniref:hypothetical protein n=1 Tax=Nitrosopumilus sp. b1 TaxID=2109907 RepID=UPI0015F78069|nr:hypothetical protein [Nitrosopumilus sp. b1]KAF6242685.1 hypothetical protein C6988_05690 [Nitrosopumilus sp. b1]
MSFIEKNGLALKVVFSNFTYIGLWILVFAGLFLPLTILTEFIFFEPYFLFYVPEYQVVSFLSIIVISALTALVLSMAIYRIRFLHASTKKLRTGILGSVIGAGAGACCGGIGIALISIFGVVGGVTTTVLTNFEIPLRILSIGILVFTYFMLVRDLNRECKVKFDKFRNE